MLYLLNGKAGATIPVTDRGFHYGDGLFETIRWNGKLVFFDEHLKRLLDGCLKLKIAPPDPELLLRECEQLVAAKKNAVLKIIISRGGDKRGYGYDARASSNRLVLAYDYPSYPQHYWQSGVKTIVCNTRISRNATLAGIKHLNRLEQVMARAEWQDEDISEGFMRDNKDLLAEGVSSNVFLVNRGQLSTPDLSDFGVRGIIRDQVLNLASKLKIPVQVTDIHVDQLYTADEVFVTNSVIGLWPVSQVAEKSLPVGETTKNLQTALNERMEDL